MIEIQNKIDAPDILQLTESTIKSPLFFDIETTGLSAKNASIYLIGVVYQSGKNWYYRQWFAERPAEEERILKAFFAFAQNYETLIHFNGTTFDIPFVKACAGQYHINYPLSEKSSIDLFLRLKPYKNLLNLERMNQKSIECRLGLNREDKYNGGELISFYQDYLKSPSETVRNLLLLHNAEDLSGMLTVATALNYELVLQAPFSVQNWNQYGQFLSLTLSSDTGIHVPLSVYLQTDDGTSLSMQNSDLTLNIPLIQTTLKCFFKDYRNYYYLPDEDKAIHKSVGEFVDPAFRQKAAADTCYQRFPGTFIKQFKPYLQPAFYREYNGKDVYLRLDKIFFEDKDLINAYLHRLFAHCINKKLFG